MRVKLALSSLVQGIDEMKEALRELEAAQAEINVDNPTGMNDDVNGALAGHASALDQMISDAKYDPAADVQAQIDQLAADVAAHNIANDAKIANITQDYVDSTSFIADSFEVVQVATRNLELSLIESGVVA